MFHRFGSSLESKVLDSSPTSDVQAQPLTVAPSLYRPHSIEDKTTRLMVKATLKSQTIQETDTVTIRKEE